MRYCRIEERDGRSKRSSDAIVGRRPRRRHLNDTPRRAIRQGGIFARSTATESPSCDRECKATFYCRRIRSTASVAECSGSRRR